MIPCGVEGCGAMRAARGYCNKHYKRLRKYGDLSRRQRAPGTGKINRDGYIMIYKNGVEKFEHTRVVEAAIGKPLPNGAQIHHVDYNRANNAPTNLVVCPSVKYHRLLHQRTDAVLAGFPPDHRKCQFCKQYDSPENLSLNRNTYHKSCAATSMRERSKT